MSSASLADYINKARNISLNPPGNSSHNFLTYINRSYLASDSDVIVLIVRLALKIGLPAIVFDCASSLLLDSSFRQLLVVMGLSIGF
jgi:hypothetical protein